MDIGEMFCWIWYLCTKISFEECKGWKAALAAVTMRWWNPRPWEKATRQTVESQFRTTGQQTVTWSRFFLQEFMRDHPGEITSSFPISHSSSSRVVHPYEQKIKPRRQEAHRWTRMSWQNSSLRRTRKWLEAEQQPRLSESKILPYQADSLLKWLIWWIRRYLSQL